MKRFVFLVTNDGDFLMVSGFGNNAEEAKAYTTSNLHHAWSVVENKSTIQNYINENKGVKFSKVKNERLLKDLAHFESDLNSLETQLKEG